MISPSIGSLRVGGCPLPSVTSESPDVRANEPARTPHATSASSPSYRCIGARRRLQSDSDGSSARNRDDTTAPAGGEGDETTSGGRRRAGGRPADLRQRLRPRLHHTGRFRRRDAAERGSGPASDHPLPGDRQRPAHRVGVELPAGWAVETDSNSTTTPISCRPNWSAARRSSTSSRTACRVTSRTTRQRHHARLRRRDLRADDPRGDERARWSAPRRSRRSTPSVRSSCSSTRATPSISTPRTPISTRMR